MSNPNPKEANKARRKHVAGTKHINARVSAPIWEAIEQEFEHKSLANWASKSEIVNFGLSLVLEQAMENDPDFTPAER